MNHLQEAVVAGLVHPAVVALVVHLVVPAVVALRLEEAEHPKIALDYLPD